MSDPIIKSKPGDKTAEIHPVTMCIHNREVSIKIRTLLISFFAFSLSLGSSSLLAGDPTLEANYNYDLSKFVGWMEASTREKEIPGVALAIVSREGIMHMQTWGVKSIETREPVHTDSVSVSYTHLRAHET